MVRDAGLELHSGDVTASGSTDPIDLDGGTWVICEVLFTSNASGSSPLLDAKFQVSLDGGSNYLSLATFPQFSDVANKGDSGSILAMPAYIPHSNANPSARGADTKVKARMNWTVAGSGTPTFTLKAYVTHLSGVPYGSLAGSSGGVSGRYGPLDAIANFD